MTRLEELLIKKHNNEATSDELNELVELLVTEKNSAQMAIDLDLFKFKLKPVYQFQSVEFEVWGTKADIPHVMELYSDVLSELMKITPEQTKNVPVVLASEKQKEIMRKFGIKFGPLTTQAEAQQLIKESIEAQNK